MLRWTILSISSVLIITIASFALVVRSKAPQEVESDVLAAYQETREALSSSRSGKLTNEVHDLIEKSKQPLEVMPTPTPNETKVTQLEQTVLLLQQKLLAQENFGHLNQSSSQIGQATTNPSPTPKPVPVYIPIGIGITTTSTDWVTLSSPEIEIDTNDYPGYQAAYLLADIRVNQAASKGFVRLINLSDNTPIYSSEAVGSSTDLTTVTSSSFNLTAGKKRYRLQVKSDSGKDATIQFVKIKLVY